MNKNFLRSTLPILGSVLIMSCGDGKKDSNAEENTLKQDSVAAQDDVRRSTSEPLVTDNYTADPSAHVFEGKIYIYPSHDWDSGIPEDDTGAHFNMKDYHVYSMDSIGGEVTDHGVVLDVDDVAWASRQMWAPDAAEKDGKYYFYFPAKDENDIFRIGVAVGDSPAGPFEPQEEPIEGSYSIDPAVYEDTDGEYYMYFGGIWGGQLQDYRNNEYQGEEDIYPADDEPALSPMIAKMSDDMLSFAEEPREIQLLDEDGEPILTGDNDRRFFEAAWVNKIDDTYYFSYSTGDTHNIAYATGDNPYGPFTYQGVILEPVLGWTNHHSIVEYEGKWYLFYHDSSLSEGKTYLRSIKMTELQFNEDGSIQTINAMVEAREESAQE
ncbi:glycoside hydrolase family 43 protein [Salegentibacter sp. F188]|uniref:Glycoside hydrolase family 43 protein n=1 Tax=Autumnicola patrickiae TaxID=3075591 RepID=A0ABU3E374_9FLAO|nr:glycoside hydrolase family 43 protein [Salegentibacter sp. F188]MDT0690375.1 glycoside hydrolase family 43 protein [Salegentibacter sp. F188]